MGILLIFAFVSGLITIAAPCIWPLLPILLTSTATGGHRKPLGVVIGIISSFAVFTLTISYIIKIIPFDPNVLRLFAVVVIGLLGLTLLIPKLSSFLEGYVSRLSGKFSIQNQGNGLWAGLITGLALGIVWSPCAGPILATIATLAATSRVNSAIILVTFVYVLGIGIPLFLFATFGRFIFTKSRSISKYTGRIQQVFGVIMILTAVSIYTNFDKTLQIKLLDLSPSYGNILTKFETSDKVKQQLDRLKGKTSESNVDQNNLFNIDSPASDFTGITNWLNLPGNKQDLTMSELRGKVVLVDFWTYTCINCIRTLPHVTSWYEKYKDQGFVVIGVHTPEFEFEKKSENVLNAIKQYKINYPVAQDNNYETWNAYSNQYWPAEYLIDAKGNVRRTHFGEGEYDQTEKAIQELLIESGKKINASLEQMPDQTPRMRLSPETYLGSRRMQYLVPNGRVEIGSYRFTLSENTSVNHFSLGGDWDVMTEYSSSRKGSILEYNFAASKVFLVMRPGDSKPKRVKVYLDGKLVTSESGKDVINGTATVDSDKLYELINLESWGNHTLKLEFQDAGTEVFAFTFG